MQKKWAPLIVFIVVCLTVFFPFFIKSELPIPSDSLVGLYHPFRDHYATEFPNGIPYKNFLVTDPIRQQYPWRFLAIEQIKDASLPLWNPYTFAGTPLLGNIQSAPLYPLNIFFFILPFEYSWSFLVFLQPVLMGIFLFCYLRFIKLSVIASLFASVAYAFSGFSVAWMEWNTVIQTALWLPLVLLSIEKLLLVFNSEHSKFKNEKYLMWGLVFVASLSSSLLAGHLQTFFYLFLVSIVYVFLRSIQSGIHKKGVLFLAACYILVVLATSIQWVPSLQFIQLSARGVDQIWTEPGWFIPYQHMVQFIAPDFFGNPTTLNYFGTWNYAELVGYIGLIPLAFAMYAIFFQRRKIVHFFIGVIGVSFLFSFDNPIARLPFEMAIPFLSTSQPTRLLFLIDFSLVMLAAFGIDAFLKHPRKFIIPLMVIGAGIGFLWFTVIVNPFFLLDSDVSVAKRNLYLPSALFVGLTVIYFFMSYVKDRRMMIVGLIALFLLSSFDSLRFAHKFLSFSSTKYVYPETKSLEYLQNQEGLFRVTSNDPRILPPNTSIMYKIQTIEGYDPLYIKRYGELMVALKRNEPNIDPPFGFNRIVAIGNINNAFLNVLGVRYLLSLDEIDQEGFEEVYNEGITRVYKNNTAFERVFTVNNVVSVSSKQDAIQELFEQKDNLSDVAVVEGYDGKSVFSRADISVESYSPNSITFSVSAVAGDTFVVFMDSYYPTWNAVLENGEKLQIYRTNYAFRGVVVPQGEHIVEFRNTLFSYED